MSILSISDFQDGMFKIPLNPNQEQELQFTIDFVERNYLVKLFGIELYEAFILDQSEPRFVKIFDPIIYEYFGTPLLSDGLKSMLKGFVLYHHVRDLNKRLTTVNTTIVESENSKPVSTVNSNINSKYNLSVKNYRVISNYMRTYDKENYPEFKGVGISNAYFF